MQQYLVEYLLLCAVSNWVMVMIRFRFGVCLVCGYVCVFVLVSVVIEWGPEKVGLEKFGH